MLLRRITEHVKAQNWFAVFLDFLIVVLGVFIGIQVSNWNDARIEKRLANDYHDRIIEELQEGESLLTSSISYLSQVRTHAESAASAFNDDTRVNPEKFVIDAYQASQTIEHRNTRATFDELISTGQIYLIDDPDLRKALIYYFEFDWSKIDVIRASPPYREHLRREMPHDVQAEIRKQCGDRFVKPRDIVVLTIPPDCDIQMEETKLQAAADAVRQAPGLEKDLRFNLADLDSKIAGLTQSREDVRELIDRFREGRR